MLLNALSDGINELFAGTIGAFFEILIKVVILPVTATIWLANFLMMILGIIILAAILIVLFYALIKHTKPTLKEFGIMLLMAIFQTAIFGVFILIIKQSLGIWVSVFQYGRMFTTLETGIIFLIFVIVGDIFGELIRNFWLKHKFKTRWIALFIAIIQTLFFLVIVNVMGYLNILHLKVVDANYDYIGFILEFVYFFIPILIAELVIEAIRKYTS